MSDPNVYLTTAVAALAGLAMLVFAALNGWRGWLQLKQQQLRLEGDLHHHSVAPSGPSASARIEIADLKERIRKLEAIASGVDL
ncbi:hypothetical protein ASG29_05515 [Sphingomonas sp. Leaf412]|uniref:hypothetical protein n=1 Tax=Sphingomonas sp. Leaf412 TaxID=1736370 RepID=UPI0006F80273|nr:hypothetical protein [Sphingomonas sp. Leaf412]KQT33796.1 hypothetical protein ASG29_05515 [Sphingomonas sp. Leaf412]